MVMERAQKNQARTAMLLRARTGGMGSLCEPMRRIRAVARMRQGGAEPRAERR
jgi:hypothetical protein